MSSAKRKFVIVLPPKLTVPSRSAIILPKKMLKRVGGEQNFLAYSGYGSDPFSCAVIVVDSAGRLVVEAFYASGQAGMDVIRPHGCPQSCVPNSVERLLEDFAGVADTLHIVF